MTEKPIIFSTPMVQAILAGKKTQTRRVLKTPGGNPVGVFIPALGCALGGHGVGKIGNDSNHFGFMTLTGIVRPRYMPGDILWVRETWKKSPYEDGVYAYKADRLPEPAGCQYLHWRPSIHMPRAAARIFLNVTDVRVERLQDISESDAKAEGIRSYWLHKEHGEEWHENNTCFVGTANTHFTRVAAFAELWNSINAKRGYGWDANPWVWVYSFEKQSPPPAAMPQTALREHLHKLFEV